MDETSPLKKFAIKEVQEHPDRKSPWIIIHDKVYDVTNWFQNHPGGEEILLGVAGKDASELFEDFGHFGDARSIMKRFLVGELRDEDKTGSTGEDAPRWIGFRIDNDNSSSRETSSVPLALALTTWLLFQLFKKITDA